MAKTAEQIKAEFRAKGKTLRSWATAQGFAPETVSRVLNGQHKATRGVGHEIAVRLGMKKAA